MLAHFLGGGEWRGDGANLRDDLGDPPPTERQLLCFHWNLFKLRTIPVPLTLRFFALGIWDTLYIPSALGHRGLTAPQVMPTTIKVH